MSKIVSDKLLDKVNNIHHDMAKLVIWVVIAVVILGAIGILFSDDDPGKIVGKLLGTLAVVMIVVGVSINNIRRAAMDAPIVQGLALMGLVANVVWGILLVVMIWMPELATVSVYRLRKFCNCYGTVNQASPVLKIAVSAICLAVLGWIGSNLMAAYEGSRRSLIRPLKVTALVCLTYNVVFGMVVFCMDYELGDSNFVARLGVLSGFTFVIWAALGLTVAIMGDTEKRRDGLIPVQQMQTPQASGGVVAGVPQNGVAGGGVVAPGNQQSSAVVGVGSMVDASTGVSVGPKQGDEAKNHKGTGSRASGQK